MKLLYNLIKKKFNKKIPMFTDRIFVVAMDNI